jgi:sugar/nucleoside kinase (ribokinase family)
VSVLAVGTVAFDSIETPFGSRERILGGSAIYIALAARYMAQDVRIHGVAGDDFPRKYIDQLEERGIDTEGLTIQEGERTFYWSGRYYYDLNQRDTLETQLNVLQSFDPVLPDRYADSDIVCLGNLDPSIQLRALEQVDDPQLVVADTMNYWIENTPEDLAEMLQRVDLLVINDSEARELADEPNLVKAAGKIRGMGPQTLVIKKGEHGALLFMDKTLFSVPAYPLEDIQDPTGAGDTFAGGLIGHMDRSQSFTSEEFKRSIIYGSALASYVVEAFGPEQILDLSIEQIATRAREFRELTAIPELASMRV